MPGALRWTELPTGSPLERLRELTQRRPLDPVAANEDWHRVIRRETAEARAVVADIEREFVGRVNDPRAYLAAVGKAYRAGNFVGYLPDVVAAVLTGLAHEVAAQVPIPGILLPPTGLIAAFAAAAGLGHDVDRR